MSELTLKTSRKINAPREKVFAAWLDPDMLKRFMQPGEGVTVPVATSDAAEGGNFTVVMQAGEQEIPISGTYRKIDPHSCIVFSWVSPFGVEDSEVTLDFEAEDDGTLLTLTQVRFIDEASRENHLGGWTNILAALDSTLGQG